MKFGALTSARRLFPRTASFVRVSMSVAVNLTRTLRNARRQSCSRLCKRRPKGSCKSASSAAQRCRPTSRLRRPQITQSFAPASSTKLLTLLTRRITTSKNATRKISIHEIGTNGFNCSFTTCQSRALSTTWHSYSRKKSPERTWTKKRPKSTPPITSLTN